MITHHVSAIKRRTGERIEGVTWDDGLTSLFAVTTASGETAYVSVLDEILEMRPLSEPEKIEAQAAERARRGY